MLHSLKPYNKGFEFRIGRWPPVWVHVSALIVVLCITSSLWGRHTFGWIATAVAVALGALLSILAHELGHALTAEHFGHRPTLIRLHGGGGEAVIDYDRLTRREERLIIAAGPLANIVLGCLLLLVYEALRLSRAPELDPVVRLYSPFGAWFQIATGLRWLGTLNLAWAVVNLLPALPLDGGALVRTYLDDRIGQRRSLLYGSLCGVGLSIQARAVFLVSLLIGPVIWSPPSFRLNWETFKQSRHRAPPQRFRVVTGGRGK